MKKFIPIAVALLLNLPAYFSDDVYVDGESIQDAINSAEEGDVIYVGEGVYYENLIVNKSITLIGQGKVTIDGAGKTAITINANGVIVKNIEFINSNDYVIKINGKSCVLVNCTVHKGRYGIFASGANITECTIYECGYGLLIAEYNNVKECLIYKCGVGIDLNDSKNVIDKCIIHTCGIGIYVESSKNFINECKIYKNNNNQGGIFLLNSNSNLIRGCNISYGGFGIRMIESNGNKIERSKITNNRYGIKMEGCEGNEIKKCSIKGNRFGIQMENCRHISINYNDVNGKMYSIDALLSTCNARHNYWGSPIPKKIHKRMSRVSYVPWLLKPVYEDDGVNNDRIKKEKANRCHIETKERECLTSDDFDPTVDIKIGVKIKRARSIGGEKIYTIKILIDGKKNESKFKGDVMPSFIAWQDVNDGKQIVEIEFEIGRERKQIFYDLARGDWYGADYLADADGYGHIKFEEVEMWFSIFYNDYDNDGLTYWEEVNIYHTNPMESDYGKDYDGDGLPIQWEDRYGFNDFFVENHSIDYDGDGLNDYEEYYMVNMLSDPFARDVFIEIDYMPEYEIYEKSIQMLYDVFTKYDITMHIYIDDELPYMEKVYYKDAVNFYWDYFLDGNISNQKHGIFRYVILVSYGTSKRGGHVFVGWDNCDAILLACQYIKDWKIGKARKTAYASLLMHELGHTFGLWDNTFGGIDNESCNMPWLKGYWKYANYKSCMNYRYAFQLVNYSDGSHGRNDFDDWGNINLAFFKNSWYYT
ncbi:MAG: hypothetical protein FE041_03480 [Thermoplasmata archaeon]|nr:MAG: hypothetical protein FE041_03480 [Thermoplasmata archaeon]